MSKRWWPGFCFLFLFIIAGCHTVRPLPPANLKEPGWVLHEGQAVWRTKKGSHELAGEILMATKPDGRTFIQFSKNPFPLVIAQATSNSWEVAVPTQNKRYSGHGRPPARLIWLYLPRVLQGEAPPKRWTWKTLPNKGWRFENEATGESIEGYFLD